MAYSAAGHSPLEKNWRKGASRTSLRYSCLGGSGAMREYRSDVRLAPLRTSLRYSCLGGSGAMRGETGTGTETTPNITSPPDNSFLKSGISFFSEFLYCLMTPPIG